MTMPGGMSRPVSPIMLSLAPPSSALLEFHQYEAWRVALKYRLAHARIRTEDYVALDHEFPNLWSAAQHAFEHQEWTVLIGFWEALRSFLDLRGYWQEYLVLNTWATTAAENLQDWTLQARLAHDRADILQQKGQYADAISLYQTAEMCCRRVGDSRMALRSRHMRALALRALGQYSEADRLCRATIDEADALGEHQWLAHPLYVQALLARDRGNMLAAQGYVAQALARLSELQEPAMCAQCRHFLGELALRQGDLSAARSELENSLRLSRQAHILRRVAATQRLLGDLECAEGHPERGETWYAQATQITDDIGDRPQLARVLVASAKIAVRLSQGDRAYSLLRSAISVHQEIGDQRGVALAGLLLVRDRVRCGHWGQALDALLNACHAAWQVRRLLVTQSLHRQQYPWRRER